MRLTIVKPLAESMLDTARKILAADEDLIPVAFLVAEGQVTCIDMSEVRSFEQMQEVCRVLRDKARETQALAVIVIQEAFTRKATKEEAATLTEEDLRTGPKSPCIAVSVIERDQSWGLVQPYAREGGTIHFEQAVGTAAVLANLFPLGGWGGSDTVH
jgi:hypothetical protein